VSLILFISSFRCMPFVDSIARIESDDGYSTIDPRMGSREEVGTGTCIWSMGFSPTRRALGRMEWIKIPGKP